MPDQDPQVITRIRKLLALSKSSNPNEADSAPSLADKLLEKHGLTEDQVLQSTSEGFSQSLIIERSNHLTKSEMELAIIVAEFHDCVVVFKNHPKPEKAFAVGESENTKEVCSQYAWIHDQLYQVCIASSHRFGRVPSLYWKRSFWMGAVDSLAKRLEDLKKKSAPEAEEEKETLGFWSRIVNKITGRRSGSNKLAVVEQNEFSKAEEHVKQLGVDYEEVEEDEGAQILDPQAYKVGVITGQRMDLYPDSTPMLDESSERATNANSVP
jgi:hypothetical protein